MMNVCVMCNAYILQIIILLTGLNDDYVGDDMSKQKHDQNQQALTVNEPIFANHQSRTVKDTLDQAHFTYNYEPQYLGLDTLTDEYDMKKENRHKHDL